MTLYLVPVPSAAAREILHDPNFRSLTTRFLVSSANPGCSLRIASHPMIDGQAYTKKSALPQVMNQDLREWGGPPYSSTRLREH